VKRDVDFEKRSAGKNLLQKPLIENSGIFVSPKIDFGQSALGGSESGRFHGQNAMSIMKIVQWVKILLPKPLFVLFGVFFNPNSNFVILQLNKPPRSVAVA
jgi:hypothetical protein